MKEIRTDGITFISPVPEGTEEWYYGLNYDHGDLYEAEELYKQGFEIDGRDLILIRYPEGKIFRPVPKGREHMWNHRCTLKTAYISSWWISMM